MKEDVLSTDLLKFPMPVGDVFVIEVVEGSVFTKEYKDTKMYQIKNIFSDVVEGESISLARAILQCQASEKSLARLQGGILGDHEMLAMETMFDEMDDGGRTH